MLVSLNKIIDILFLLSLRHRPDMNMSLLIIFSSLNKQLECFEVYLMPGFSTKNVFLNVLKFQQPYRVNRGESEQNKYRDRIYYFPIGADFSLGARSSGLGRHIYNTTKIISSTRRL